MLNKRMIDSLKDVESGSMEGSLDTPPAQALRVNDVAKVVHNTLSKYIKAYGETHGKKDVYKPYPKWEKLEDKVKQRNISTINEVINNSKVTAKDLHDTWMEQMKQDGYEWGEYIDEDKRTHPKILPFEKLETYDQIKDYLFLSIVKELMPFMNEGGETGKSLDEEDDLGLGDVGGEPTGDDKGESKGDDKPIKKGDDKPKKEEEEEEEEECV